MDVARTSEPPLSVVAIANIRAELARRQMSHRRLASLIQVTPESLSRRMRNDVPLAVDELARIAAALELLPEELLHRSAQRTAPLSRDSGPPGRPAA